MCAADGVQPAYFSYPKQPPRIFPQPPLKGIDVTGIVSTPTPPPPPMDQNATWQEVNRQVGPTLRFSIVPSPDYPTKLATVMAGDDTPDLVYINQGGPTPVPNLLSWLQAKCLDLTPYANSNAMLQGDFLSGITDIVTGRRPIGDLNTLIADWRTKGGDKMRTEFEQSLKATAG